MKILVDENIPKHTVRWLEDKGHEVLDVRGSEDEGVPDSVLWKMAQAEQRLVITTDKWFGNVLEQPHFGVLIILLKRPNLQRIHDRILLALECYPQASWARQVVVMRDNVRSVRKIQ